MKTSGRRRVAGGEWLDSAEGRARFLSEMRRVLHEKGLQHDAESAARIVAEAEGRCSRIANVREWAEAMKKATVDIIGEELALAMARGDVDDFEPAAFDAARKDLGI